MRVTPGMINAQVSLDLQNALAALARQQQKVSTGRRISAPADDPGGAAQALVIRSRQAANDQFQKNVNQARDTLSATDGALRSVVETITRAKELAIQGANDTNGALERQALGREVDQLLEGLVALGNSRGTDGRFIFGGQESMVAPYTVTRAADGTITAVAVNARGIDGLTPAEVSEGLTVATTVSGTTVFGALTDVTNTFDVLIRLRDRLAANNAAQALTLAPDVGATGAANPAAYGGIVTATDLQVAGASGTTFVGLTAAGDDTVSAVAPSTSAIATAAAINAANGTTGVAATATAASITYAGTFGADLTLDGSAGANLVINGTSVTGAVSGASAAARRDALIALVNAQVTGVVATPSGTSGFTLTAADGRNISIRTDGTVGGASVNAAVFGFTSGLVAERVVARGGVSLTSTRPFTTTVAQVPADQISGAGTAASVQAALDELTTALDRATVPQTTVGSRLSWLDLLETRLKDESITQASSLSRIEDLDFAKAIEDLKELQTFYEAGLASGAQMLQVSLLNFLR